MSVTTLRPGGLEPTAPRLRAAILRLRWPILILSALLLGFTVIFPQIGLLEWVALIPAIPVILLLAADPGVRLRRLYGYGFAFFFAYLLVTFHWFLYMYPLDFADMSRPASALVVSVAWVGLSAFQAVGAALLFPLLAIAVRGKWLSRCPLLHPLLLAALWTALEWWWAHSGWSGVPWSRLALGQAQLLPTMQISWLFGSYAVSFLILAVNGLLGYILLNPSRRLLCGALAAGLFAGNLAFGAIRLATFSESGETVRVAAVQGNKSSLEYWSFDTVGEVMDIYEDLTRQAAAEGATLIVWPESGIPANVDTDDYMYDYLTELAESCGVTILAGVFTEVEEGSDAAYNSIVAAMPDGTLHENRYHKRNPVPFGEFVPFRKIVMAIAPPLAEINTLDEDIPAGREPAVFHFDNASVGALICFDSIYETNARDAVRDGAEIFTVSTNDSWFRDSRGVWMHHAQSQLRAIESGRWVARSAVTGVSSIISPTGEITASLDALKTGYVVGDVTCRTAITPYTAMGDVFAYLVIATVMAALLCPVAECVASAIRPKNKT